MGPRARVFEPLTVQPAASRYPGPRGYRKYPLLHVSTISHFPPTHHQIPSANSVRVLGIVSMKVPPCRGPAFLAQLDASL